MPFQRSRLDATIDGGDERRGAVDAVEFALRWLPYGGADSYEIFMTFGLTPAQFGQRLHRAVDSPPVVHEMCLDPDERGQLRSEAHRVAALSWPAPAGELAF